MSNTLTWESIHWELLWKMMSGSGVQTQDGLSMAFIDWNKQTPLMNLKCILYYVQLFSLLIKVECMLYCVIWFDFLEQMYEDHIPFLSSETSLREGLFHDYKKHGKVMAVRLQGSGNDRFAVVCFKKPEDAEKALDASREKLFFGVKIQVSAAAFPSPPWTTTWHCVRPSSVGGLCAPLGSLN